MDDDRRLREQIVGLLRGGNAHMPFAEAALIIDRYVAEAS